MTRPSRNQDKLLIEAGKKLLPELGVSGMSIQRVADEAGVNLGMFSYHFKTKANFIQQVLRSIREDAQGAVGFTFSDTDTSIEKFQKFLFFMAKTFRDQRKLVLSLFKDILNQDPDVSEMVLKKSNDQLEVLRQLIIECQKDGYIDEKTPVRQIELFCNSAMKGPIVMVAAMERIQQDNLDDLAPYEAEVLTDSDISQLVSMILRGIRLK
ncbi:putative TetR-family regulatory protein [Halobacteriovorax marinus SJ]|uniref:TetR-family regulatory protein n=1 Tax=Halobacteriovorax marinus (strain ATCC BAA-682 / DSM 15412 / SJ) TaxID=862908 RepID=E1X3J1_HALMS|nr:TetR/AcrR family transcriptional regulator [Halobacteriovorax marinus]CBW26920.1 putative TetR-family regulatory protein [Halobacteriovorax marinus SJ]